MPDKPAKTDREIEQLYESGSLRLTQERNDFLLPQILDFVTRRHWMNLRPEYQRRLVWDKKKKSLFIESLLMNVPIPPVFLYEYDLSRYEVMDGQQRLNAVLEFYKDELVLTGLETWADLNGRKRSECPSVIRRGLDRRRLSATVLVAEAKVDNQQPFDVRREVFERLNTGGQQLNHQELRHALYPGAFNEMLIKLASEPPFRRMWKIPASGKQLADNDYYRRMRDCEFVLRFFAFRESSRIKGSVRSTLDKCMKEGMDLPEAAVAELKKDFRSRLTLAREIFGVDAFLLNEGDGRQKLSAPLYDAIMVSLDRLWRYRTALKQHRERVVARLHATIQKPKIYELIVARANTSSATRERISAVEKVIRSALK